MSQGKATSFPLTTKFNKAYRTDREKRDFVACGAAAGVASAFGAPLGGLLFAIEEGASYINHTTLWRVAMSAITSYFILNIGSSLIKGKKLITLEILINVLGGKLSKNDNFCPLFAQK